MLAIEREKKRLAEEEARKEREEAARLAKKLAKGAGTTGQEAGAQILDQAEKKEDKVVKKKAAVRVGRGKASSVITTTTWKAAVTDKMELIKAVAAGRMPAEVLEINMAALNKIAIDTRLEREVDGVRYWEAVGTTVR
jgi:HPt (histidine-containing phosphotransfer) domain-containing protein